jgi:hypothetical protein
MVSRSICIECMRWSKKCVCHYSSKFWKESQNLSFAEVPLVKSVDCAFPKVSWGYLSINSQQKYFTKALLSLLCLREICIFQAKSYDNIKISFLHKCIKQQSCSVNNQAFLYNFPKLIFRSAVLTQHYRFSLASAADGRTASDMEGNCE